MSELDPVLASAKFSCPVEGVESREMTLGELAQQDFGKSPFGRMIISSFVSTYGEHRENGMTEEDAIQATKTQLFGPVNPETTEPVVIETSVEPKKKLNSQQN